MKFKKNSDNLNQAQQRLLSTKDQVQQKKSTHNSKKLNANLKCLYQKHFVSDGCDLFLMMVVIRLAPFAGEKVERHSGSLLETTVIHTAREWTWTGGKT